MDIEPRLLTDKKHLLHSLYFPFFFILVIWCMKIIELASGTSFAFLGVYPLKAQGLIGIITAPLIHASFTHLIDNSIPLFILMVGVFYFYRPLGYKIFFLTWGITGIWVWCWARQAYHIGSSGIVYGLASFLVFSGILRRIPGLVAVSLAVVFLYGSMIWGIFPFIPDVSWESHLSGGVAGLILSIVYRKDGPQPEKYTWEYEPENIDEEDNDDYGLMTKFDESQEENKQQEKPEGKIVYMFKPGKGDTGKND